MHKIILSPKEKIDLENRHRATRDVYELDRIKTILLRSEGWYIENIAQALRVHVNTVTRHLKDYLENSKLNVSPRGGSNSLLSGEQIAQLSAHLTAKLYHHTHEIVKYIRERWGIEYRAC